MKNAAARSEDDVAASSRVFHRMMVTRSPWDGPSASAAQGTKHRVSCR